MVRELSDAAAAWGVEGFRTVRRRDPDPWEALTRRSAREAMSRVGEKPTTQVDMCKMACKHPSERCVTVGRRVNSNLGGV
jgi:hypothetical protein